MFLYVSALHVGAEKLMTAVPHGAYGAAGRMVDAFDSFIVDVPLRAHACHHRPEDPTTLFSESPIFKPPPSRFFL